ncbi:MAG TPA: hypothetical protein VIY47_15315 [Ignavibacteriaceae bacterium]
MKKTHPHVDFIKKVSIVPFKNWRTQDISSLKKMAFENLETLQGVTTDEYYRMLLPTIVSDPEVISYKMNMEWLSHQDLGFNGEEILHWNELMLGIPFYMDAKDKNVVLSTMIAIAPLKIKLMDFYNKNNKFPSENLSVYTESLSFPSLPIKEITLDKNGKIYIEFSKDFHLGFTISLIPSVMDKNVSWECFVPQEKSSLSPDHCMISRG